MEDYSKNILRVVVAQICQTIGWHSIQSTPLELLIDILHKYMQEISVRSLRYTNLYGRVEANLDDVGLSFRDLGINIPDLLEYINNVDSVPCAVEVPRFPVRKESSLNFLKPGSKEVITRPVHIHEHLPPVYPEKEDEGLPTPTESIPSIPNPIGSSADPDCVITDITNTAANTANIANNKGAVFRKPDLSDITSSLKKSRLFHEDEGRPTREISSVMMTSSGFISPAREGKLPESKPPVIPEYKPPRSATPTPPPPPPPSLLTPTSAVPVSPATTNTTPEVKVAKKVKRQRNQGANANNTEAKEQRKRERHLAKIQKRRGGNLSTLDTAVRKKQRIKELKVRNPPARLHNIQTESPHQFPTPAGFEALPPDVSLPADLTIKSEAVPLLSCGSASTDFSPAATKPIPAAIKTNISRADEVKLSSEPDKKKYSIFKKISKNSREETAKTTSHFYSTYQSIFDNIPMLPESTTIRPIPQMRPNSPSHTDPNVIVVDDDTPPRSSSPAGMLLPSMMLPMNLPAATSTSNIMQQQFCGGENSFRGVRPSPVKKQQRKPRKTKQQILSEQSAPLNLSNEATGRISNPNIGSQPTPPSQPKTPRRKQNKVGRPKRTNPASGFPPASAPFPGNVDLPPSMVPENLKRDDMSPLNIFKDNQFLSGMQRYPMLGSFHLLGPGLIPNTSFMPRHPLFPFRNPFGYNDFGLRPPYRPPYRPPKIDETPSTPPPTSLPLELENSVFCNVPPLVPESMKFQLPPELISKSNKTLGSLLGASNGGSGGESNSQKTASNKIDSLSIYHGSGHGHSIAASKSPKNLDAPIEISDDEKSVTKSDTEADRIYEEPPGGGGGTSNAGRGYSDRIPFSSEIAQMTAGGKNANSLAVQQKANNDSNDGFDSVIESNDAAGQGDKNENVGDEIPTVGGGVLSGKSEKKRDKEHKKGKRDKDGKIKKKKDKKDKNKNKEKAEKRKEEKKEKDRSKKKKEKRKEKMMRVQPFNDMIDDAKLPTMPSGGGGDQAQQSDVDASVSGMSIVPKLTLKFGSPRSIGSDDSPEIRKLSTKSLNGAEDSVDNLCLDERRESSPELARISPLVTRPPKQKTAKEKATDTVEQATSANIMSSSIINPSSASSSNAGGSVTSSRGPGRPPKNQNTSIASSIAQNQQTSASRSAAMNPITSAIAVDETVSGSTESRTSANTPLQGEKGPGPAGGTSSKNSIGKSKSFRASLKTANVSNSAGPSTTVQANNDPIDAEGNQVWICPACGRVDDGTPMIGCDGCDAWYHWECVGIQEPPHENEDWYCRVCIAKKQESNGSDRKKKRKKKNKAN